MTSRPGRRDSASTSGPGAGPGARRVSSRCRTTFQISNDATSVVRTGHITRRQLRRPRLPAPWPTGGRRRRASARIAAHASGGGATGSSPIGSVLTMARYCARSLAHVAHVATWCSTRIASEPSSAPKAYPARSSAGWTVSSVTAFLTSPLRLDERPENGPETLQGLTRPTLDGSQRLAQFARDLYLRMSSVVSQFDRLALSDRELLQGAGHRAAQRQGVRGIPVGGFTGEPRQRFLLPQPGLMRPAPQEVDGAISGNPHEPPGNAPSCGVVRFPAAPAPQEGVLQHLARQLGVAHDPEREGEDEAPVARVETFEGRLLPDSHLAYELRICWLRLRAPATRYAAAPSVEFRHRK